MRKWYVTKMTCFEFPVLNYRKIVKEGGVLPEDAVCRAEKKESADVIRAVLRWGGGCMGLWGVAVREAYRVGHRQDAGAAHSCVRGRT